MSIFTFPNPIPLMVTGLETFSIKKKPITGTRVQTAVSGKESRILSHNWPIWEFELTFDALRTQTQNIDPYQQYVNIQNLEQIEVLFAMCHGRYGRFFFWDRTDNSRPDQFIGFGDGSTTLFRVTRDIGYGAFIFTEPVGGVSQGEIGAAPTLYIDNVVLPQPGNWSLQSDLMTIAFNSPPADGVSINLAFTFYYRCRFLEDMMQFDEFMYNLHELKSFKFRSVKDTDPLLTPNPYIWLPVVAPPGPTNAVEMNSFEVLSGTPASPGSLTDFTLMAWLYRDGVNNQYVDLASQPNNGGPGGSRWGITLSTFGDCGVTWQGTGNNNIQPTYFSPTWSTPGWCWVAISIHIISFANNGTAEVSLAFCQNVLGAAGDQWDTQTINGVSNPFDLNFAELPDFSLASPDWVLDNNGGFGGSIGGIDWVAFIPTFYDFSNSSNRRLFTIDDAGTLCPVDPTAESPLVLLRGDSTQFAVNRVDLVTWTETGGGGPLTNFTAPACFAP